MVVRLSCLLSPLLSLAFAYEPGIAQELPFDPAGDAQKFRYVLHIPGVYINDHSLIRHNGEWHLFFIRGMALDPAEADSGSWARDGNEIDIGHAVSADLRNWTLLPPAISIGSRGSIDAGHVYAPAVVRTGSTFAMIYTATDGPHFRAEHLCLATSPDLRTWTKWGDTAVIRPDSSWALYYPTGKTPGRPGPVSGRDPFVVHDERHGYLCYYVARMKGDGNLGYGDHEFACIAVATSPDMVTWTDRGPVLIRPIHGIDYNPWTHPESPCVVRRNDRWYLFWKGGSGTRVVASDDPLDFHSPATHFVGTSHASRVFEWQSRWYITSCSREVDDYKHKRSDRTRGLYLASLDWSGYFPTLSSPAAGIADTAMVPERARSILLERGDPLVIALGRLEVRDLRIRVLNAAGNTVVDVRTNSFRSGDGACRAVIPTRSLQSGFYLVVAEHTGVRCATRLVVR